MANEDCPVNYRYCQFSINSETKFNDLAGSEFRRKEGRDGEKKKKKTSKMAQSEDLFVDTRTKHAFDGTL